MLRLIDDKITKLGYVNKPSSAPKTCRPMSRMNSYDERRRRTPSISEATDPSLIDEDSEKQSKQEKKTSRRDGMHLESVKGTASARSRRSENTKYGTRAGEDKQDAVHVEHSYHSRSEVVKQSAAGVPVPFIRPRRRMQWKKQVGEHSEPNALNDNRVEREDDMERLKRVERLSRVKERQQEHARAHDGNNVNISDLVQSEENIELTADAATKPGAYRYAPPGYIEENSSLQDFESTPFQHENSTSRSAAMDVEASVFMVAAEILDDSQERTSKALTDAKAELHRLKSNVAEAVTTEFIATNESSCYKTYRKWFLVVCIATAIIVGAVITVVLVMAEDNDDADSTSSPTATSPPLASYFTTNEQLVEAVQHYLHNKRRNSDVATRYGWPIGNWDVSRVTDFSRVCADERFNDDIGKWNVSLGKDFSSMFETAKYFNSDIR